MARLKTISSFVFVVLFTVSATYCLAQVPKGSSPGGTTAINWGDKKLAQQLAQNVVAGPRIVIQHSGPGSTSAMLATMNRQLQAAKALGGNSGAPSSTNNGGKTLISSSQPNTLLSPASTGTLGSSRTTTDATSGGPSTQPVQPAHRSSGSISRVQPAETVCLHPAITSVDGAATGILFSPGYSYVIHGCGFGNQPGSVYLMGVQQAPLPPPNPLNAPLSLHSNWVSLLLPGTNSHLPQRNWSDTQIEVIVDPNTSGFYDSQTATVVVILSDNITQLQAHGFSFFATRATQTLSSLPTTLYGASSSRQLTILRSGTSFTPARVNDSAGHPVKANLVSPSVNSIVLPGHTFAVVREDNSHAFPAGTDTINLVYGLQSDFQVQSIQPFYASLTQSMCPSTFASSGNWNATQMGSADNISVAWQEQSCNNHGVSAYAIDVTVVGPKGVPAF